MGKTSVYRNLVFGLFTLVLAACTSVTVRPLDRSLGMRRVCIQENARVQVSDFVSVVREGFERHGIVTAVFSGTIVALSPILNSIKFWGF